jgi:hypothetical protein
MVFGSPNSCTACSKACRARCARSCSRWRRYRCCWRRRGLACCARFCLARSKRVWYARDSGIGISSLSLLHLVSAMEETMPLFVRIQAVSRAQDRAAAAAATLNMKRKSQLGAETGASVDGRPSFSSRRGRMLSLIRSHLHRCASRRETHAAKILCPQSSSRAMPLEGIRCIHGQGRALHSMDDMTFLQLLQRKASDRMSILWDGSLIAAPSGH